MIFDNKVVLVTGGTGSFGHAFTKTVLQRYPKIKKLIIFSRDELKQYEMLQIFSEKLYPQIRYFIGNVRDYARLARAFEEVDFVIHAAALKQVPAAEYNPMECIKTNVLGANNVIDAALDTNVKKVIALSTDKATAPVNLYGATKLCSDKLFVAANSLSGSNSKEKFRTSFSVVRYGNVFGSRGSVVPFFLKEKHKGVFPVTHTKMTRFNISLEKAVDLVFYALESAWGGEIFVPKIPSFRITDLVKAIDPEAHIEEVGIRPGEKLHEDMITEMDALNTLEFNDHYRILPTTPYWDVQSMMETLGGKRVNEGFRYNSENNSDWLSVDEIKQMIEEKYDSRIP